MGLGGSGGIRRHLCGTLSNKNPNSFLLGFGGEWGIRRHLCRNSEAKEFTLKDERHPRARVFVPHSGRCYASKTTAKLNPTLRWGLAEAVGFEPTVLYTSTTDFESVSLRPLRYASLHCRATSITLRVNDIQFESADFESSSLCPVVDKHSPLWLQTVHRTVCFTRRASRGQALPALATNSSQDCLLYASRHFDNSPRK